MTHFGKARKITAWFFLISSAVLLPPIFLFTSAIFSFNDSGTVNNWQALLVSLPFLSLLTLFAASASYLATKQLWLWRLALTVAILIVITPLVAVYVAILRLPD
jgi:hypothetical protein